MLRIQRSSSFQSFFTFFLPQELEKQRELFLNSDLGKLYQAIPWQELAKTFKIENKRKGPLAFFPPAGKVALMFLKAYSQTSDKRLIEQINGNVNYQLFCGIRLKAGQIIKNHKIVSHIRCELAEMLDIEKQQAILAQYWNPYISNKSRVLMDATCYESNVRFPTNQKLLWESINFLYRVIKRMVKKEGIRFPRTKYKKWENRYNQYSRKRRKPKKEKTALTRGLLKLLEKLDAYLDKLEKEYEFKDKKTYKKQRRVIKIVLEQQQEIFTTGVSPKNRIVSLFKPYLRPIVRGKEVKKVEFGAKVNKIQIDGLNFIQVLNFDPFNEGTQFEEGIYQAQQLTKVKVKQVGADAIYATNSNRKFATSQGIKTDFVRKGRAGKNEEERKLIAKKLRKERVSKLEGSFGNEKEHYSLKKIKARTQKNEALWIFFGIHAANALKIGHRMSAARLINYAA